MKHILIKSPIPNVQTEQGIQNIENAILNVVKTLHVKDRVRINTELFLNEAAVDSGGLPLQDKRTDNIPLDFDVFERQMIVLVCDKLRQKGFDVENLNIRDHVWEHEQETIRVFLTDRQVQEIAFGENYGLITYVHNNDIIKEINDIGTWLYLIELLPAHQAYLENINAFIQTKAEFDAL